jgi:structural maintenance of chromosomes protein 6
LVLQDAEKEKQSIMKQFADVTHRRMDVDDTQKLLLIELNAVKQQINNFNQTRTGIMVNSISCDCLRTLHHPEQG